MLKGDIIIIIKAVIKIMDRGLFCRPDTKTIYHIIHIIAALTTGAVSQTKIVNMKIPAIIKIVLKKTGKNLKI